MKKKINEGAKEYVWGVKNPSRIGNQYSLTPLKKKQPPKENK